MRLRRRARERRPGHGVCAPPPRWPHIGGGSEVAGACARPRENARGRSQSARCRSVLVASLSHKLSFQLSLSHVRDFVSRCLPSAILPLLIAISLSYARFFLSPVRASDLSVSNLESGRGGHSGLRDLRPSVCPPCLAFSRRDQVAALSLSLSFFVYLESRRVVSPRRVIASRTFSTFLSFAFRAVRRTRTRK